MMYFKKTLDVRGDFVDSEGRRYALSMTRRIRSSSGVNVGYEPFDSLQSALTAWHISVLEQEVVE